MTWARLLISSSVLLLASCASQTTLERNQQTRDDISQHLEQASNTTVEDPIVTPPEIIADLMPQSGVRVPGLVADIKPEPRFDVSVANAPADVFFMSLVADTDVNMVVHPSVSGTISLDLKKVSVDDVMQLVREVYGYEYRK
jgi:MSHA biogenesis protein MshL